MIATSLTRVSMWMGVSFRWLVIIIGLYLVAELVTGLIALGTTDLGLRASPFAWLGVTILCVDLVLILYLLFSHLVKAHRRSLAGLYVAAVGLCITVAITAWASRGIDDCMIGDALVVCALAGLAWQILGFAIGSLFLSRQGDSTRKGPQGD